MTFHKFIYTRGSFSIKASISPVGVFTFSLGAVSLYKITQTHAVLYYDKERSLIGIKFTDNGAEDFAIKLNKGCSKGSISFYCKKFLTQNGLRLKKTRNFDLCQEDGFIVIDLKEGA